jgi:hypothetical protein
MPGGRRIDAGERRHDAESLFLSLLGSQTGLLAPKPPCARGKPTEKKEDTLRFGHECRGPHDQVIHRRIVTKAQASGADANRERRNVAVGNETDEGQEGVRVRSEGLDCAVEGDRDLPGSDNAIGVGEEKVSAHGVDAGIEREVEFDIRS